MNEFEILEDWLKYTHRLGDIAGQDIGAITISSCDNPGWWIRIYLEKTKFEKLFFEPILQNVTVDKRNLSDDWLTCYIEDGIFNGVGGSGKLKEIIGIFAEWIQRNGGLPCVG